MNKVLDKLPALVAEELEAANAEHPPFHSLHEGWAVLKEEVDEAHIEVCSLELRMVDLWNATRDDDLYHAYKAARELLFHSSQAAAEAIQVAAMAQKLIDYIEEARKNA